MQNINRENIKTINASTRTNTKHYCAICGKEEIVEYNDPESWLKENMWHKIDLGRMQYGSKMDGSDIIFEVDDDCLTNLVGSFKNTREDS